MGQRILSDSYGDRWDVKDEDEGGIRFWNPRGETYRAAAEKRVDELTNAELVLMLDQARARAGRPPVSEGGHGGDPGGGY